MAFARGGNKNFICRAKTIPRYSFREVFNLKDENATSDKERHIFLYVPIFQRRYCWGQEQVGNFIKDAIKKDRRKGWRSLGRTRNPLQHFAVCQK